MIDPHSYNPLWNLVTSNLVYTILAGLNFFQAFISQLLKLCA